MKTASRAYYFKYLNPVNISTIVSLCCLLFGCKPTVKKEILFETLNDDKTGLHFENKLNATKELNMFNYMYFYNGAGVGAGDFNNDGWVDLFFAANLGQNTLYLNKGKLQFEDVTKQAKIPDDKAWSTGVSVVDINNDGLLDIYVCRVGKHENLNSKNQLLICKGIDKNGVPYYQDEAALYHLDFSGFSTQAAFFDYDQDGDLDMFLLNHSVHQNGSFAPRSDFTGTYSELSGDRLYRNDGNHQFTDVTHLSKINSSSISYGLGIAVADINLDGYPDLYIGNDFHENDYLYINQKDGTFSEENNNHLMHTSKFTMGVDVADINNDGFPEIISMDMLSADPYILKRSLGDDDYDIFFSKIAFGYNYQYSRNNLQLNRRNGMFSEVGLYAGVAATDWSWAPLWIDFNNDGQKDLFISNGIPKRLNDMDYVNYISDLQLQQAIPGNNIDEKHLNLGDKFPEIKIPNKFYLNKSDVQFQDMESNISNNQPTFSNGAVYADFDNDGDLDVVVNNINAPVLLYENKTSDNARKNFVDIKLTGPEKNINAIGSKLVLFCGNKIETYENNPAKGFLSSMETSIHIGLGNEPVDSSFLVWPDNSFERILIDSLSPHLSFKYQSGLSQFNYQRIANFNKPVSKRAVDITNQTDIRFLHVENSFNEFDREPLMPHMLSTEGPALAVADINNDGLEDVFVGASKTFHNAVFLQQSNGTFIRSFQQDLVADSMYEDVSAVWLDVNKDGNMDLIVASGGNEFYGNDEHLLPREYLNDGHGNLKKQTHAFAGENVTASCITSADFNGDGYPDLFLGGRSVPWNYGEIPRSYLLQNDGKGSFMDVTEKYAAGLEKIGMVTNAVWYDIDKDGDQDLIVSCEWGSITAFLNNKSAFEKKELTDKKGWWNFILPVDVDGDGDVDLVAGNLGLNSRLTASPKQPVRLYFNDFDGNGKKEQILTFYLQNKEITFATKDELQKQMPFLNKKYIYAEDFAKAGIEEIFTAAKIRQAAVSSADYFANAILINNGNLNFTAKELPWEAKLTSYRDAAIADVNNDKLPDIILAGNYYSNNIHAGRYDADFGSVLVNQGKGNFKCETLNGLVVKGEVRHILPIAINKQPAYILAKNNDSLAIFKFEQTQR